MTAVGRAIIASAPSRLDFGGGWTDVPPYPEERGGFVCNVAITRRATVTVQPLAPDTSSSSETRDPMVRAACARAGVSQVAVHLTSDFPVGAGLGGSSAAGVALAAALRALSADQVTGRGTALPNDECAALAEWSRAVEVEQMGIAGGRQDHYAAAYGGVLALSFARETTVERVEVPPQAILELERRCLLFYTGESRISGTTITAVLDAYRDRVPRVVQALERMSTLARSMCDALVAGNIDTLASLVDEHWTYQRSLHPRITTERIDALEAAARASGAIGIKALGASGGGCVMIFSPDGRDDIITEAIAPWAERLSWRVDTHGVRVAETLKPL